MVGLVLIAMIFFRDNLLAKVDVEWVKQGGGFIKSKHAPAGRFNLGEKMVYWLSVAAGLAVSVSGFALLFPFYGRNRRHADRAGGSRNNRHFVRRAILAHIYIGTLGMEGAFEAMGTGEVDLNWAREHHDRWLAERLEAEKRLTVTPAE